MPPQRPKKLENITYRHDKATGKLHITVDLNAPQRLSSSGNSMLLASSKGGHLIPDTDGIELNMCMYRKLPTNERVSPQVLYKSPPKQTPALIKAHKDAKAKLAHRGKAKPKPKSRISN